MVGLLPYLVLLEIFLVLVLLTSRRPEFHQDWRYLVIASITIWGFYIAFITEILSAFRFLTFGAILILWFLPCLGLAAWLGFTTVKQKFFWPGYFEQVSQGWREHWFILASILCMGLGLLLIGAVYPPDNHDSLTYHLPRVEHWIQNQSVAPYPTNILRQIGLTPWAEYAILQSQILSRMDYFAFGVQWVSWLGCVIGVSAITKQLGGSSRAQIFASLVSATIPMGLLQAITTQNDLAVSLWMVAFVYFLLKITLDKENPFSLILAGLAAGLVALTKGTGYIYAAPFAVAFFAVFLLKKGWGAVRAFTLIGLLALIINLPFFYRNWNTFGNPLGEPNITKIVQNKKINGEIIASNMIRNIGLNLVAPNQKLTKFMQQGVFTIHHWLGLNINNPESTFSGKYRFVPISFREDLDGNPIHLLLIVVAALVYFISGGTKQIRALTGYFFLLLAGFVLFSALLKWQPWGVRLQLPLFILYAPYVGISMNIPMGWLKSNGWKYLYFVVSLSLVLLGLIYVLAPKSYRILKQYTNWDSASVVRLNISQIGSLLRGRNTLRLFRYPDTVKQSFLGVAGIIRESACDQIGLITGWNDLEYLLWALARTDRTGATIRFEHIITDENYPYYGVNSGPYCMILVSHNFVQYSNVLQLIPQDDQFHRVYSSNYWDLLIPTR